MPHLSRLDQGEVSQGKFHASGRGCGNWQCSLTVARGKKSNEDMGRYFVFITYTPSHSPFGAFSENSIARSRNTFDGPSSGNSTRMSTNFAAAWLHFCPRYAAIASSNRASSGSYVDFSAATSINS